MRGTAAGVLTAELEGTIDSQQLLLSQLKENEQVQQVRGCWPPPR